MQLLVSRQKQQNPERNVRDKKCVEWTKIKRRRISTLQTHSRSQTIKGLPPKNIFSIRTFSLSLMIFGHIIKDTFPFTAYTMLWTTLSTLRTLRTRCVFSPPKKFKQKMIFRTADWSSVFSQRTPGKKRPFNFF